MLNIYDPEQVARLKGWRESEEVAESLTPKKMAAQKAQSASPMQAGAQSAAAGGDVSDIATSAAMASGNPYAIAAGLGLKVLAADQARKDQYKQAQYQHELTKYQAQQNALANLINITKGMSL